MYLDEVTQGSRAGIYLFIYSFFLSFFTEKNFETDTNNIENQLDATITVY